jgi:hypothetical protein
MNVSFSDVLYRRGPHVFMYCVLAWGAGAKGLGIIVPLLACLGILYSVWQYELGLRMKSVLTVHQALANPAGARLIMGDSLPSWVRHPRIERLTWLSTIMTSMWPVLSVQLNKEIKQSITEALAEVLQKEKPAFLSKLEVAEFEVGDDPPVFDGIEVLKEAVNETAFDIHLKYSGNPVFKLVVASKVGVGGTIAISDVQVDGVVRIVLGPHTSLELPCFTTVSISFVELPSIFFNLTAPMVNLDNMPGLRTSLLSIARGQIQERLLFPKRVVVPIIKHLAEKGDDHSQSATAAPKGTLRIVLHGCENLADKKAEKFWAEACLSSNEKGAKRTSSLVGRSPKFEKLMSFAVYDLSKECCVVRVFSYPSKKLLGQIELFIGALVSNPPAMPQVEPLRNLKKPDISLGTIQYSASFRAKLGADVTTAKPAPTPPRHRPPARGDSPGRDASAELEWSMSHVSPFKAPTKRPPRAHSAPRMASPATNGAPSPIPTPPSNSLACSTTAPFFDLSQSRHGIAVIHLINCRNLINADFMGLSDPYVIFRIGKETVKSKIIDDNLNPDFNQLFELSFDDYAGEILHITVYDKDVGSDEVIGTARVMLADVGDSPQHTLRKAWSLDPQGKITLEIRLLL